MVIKKTAIVAKCAAEMLEKQGFASKGYQHNFAQKVIKSGYQSEGLNRGKASGEQGLSRGGKWLSGKRR
ncbi:hypothetical protein NA78x_005458 [Anatilimnocola sp. NA78]|uniref:hypothetical protein n=1 Tax=Anatilimnocola sp. NA78 TaxID=3415683 RepID=UPI003CE531E1